MSNFLEDVYNEFTHGPKGSRRRYESMARKDKPNMYQSGKALGYAGASYLSDWAFETEAKRMKDGTFERWWRNTSGKIYSGEIHEYYETLVNPKK